MTRKMVGPGNKVGNEEKMDDCEIFRHGIIDGQHMLQHTQQTYSSASYFHGTNSILFLLT